MTTKVEATIEDLYKVDQKAELLNGEIILMSPTVSLPGYAGDEVFSSLREFSRIEDLYRVEGAHFAGRRFTSLRGERDYCISPTL